ncbi:hypothetical protein AAG906_037721 [Vitis piasezkii]
MVVRLVPRDSDPTTPPHCQLLHTTTSIVFRRLEDYYGVDLSDRKAFIREEIDVFLRRKMQKLKKEKRLMKMQRMWRKTVKSMKKKKALSRTKKRIVDFAGVFVLVLDFGKVFFGAIPSIQCIILELIAIKLYDPCALSVLVTLPFYIYEEESGSFFLISKMLK